MEKLKSGQAGHWGSRLKDTLLLCLAAVLAYRAIGAGTLTHLSQGSGATAEMWACPPRQRLPSFTVYILSHQRGPCPRTLCEIMCFVVVGATKCTRMTHPSGTKEAWRVSLTCDSKVTKDVLVCQKEKDPLDEMAVLVFLAPKAH